MLVPTVEVVNVVPMDLVFNDLFGKRYGEAVIDCSPPESFMQKVVAEECLLLHLHIGL